MIKFILKLLILILFLSCEKTNQKVDPIIVEKYDTAAIGAYFPVYPNSFWTYVDLNGDTIIHRTDSAYYLWSNYNPINNPYDTTKYYVTKYDGKAVSYYSLHVGSNSYHESGWKRILPDNISISNLFQEQYIWPNAYYSGEIIAVDTSIYINLIKYDSVIIVQEFLGPAIGILPYGKTYYAKNIGIIRSELWNQNNDSIFSVESLINHFIGK